MGPFLDLKRQKVLYLFSVGCTMPPMPNTILIAFLLYASSTAITPGPNNILTLNTVSRFGLKKSLKMMSGILSGIMIILSLTATLSFILSRYIPELTQIAKYLGALYILYLSYKIYTSKPVEIDSTVKEPRFITGLINQFLNVKIILYAITSLNSFVLPYTSHPLEIIFYAFILTMISAVSLMAWAVIGVLLSDLMRRKYKLINTILALILLESVFSLFF
jgi:cysteine/O-acetylserine efflux protein